MPDPAYDYLQQHFLKEIVNVHWGDEILSFQWAYFYDPEAVALGDICGPATHVSPSGVVALGYTTLFSLVDVNTAFPFPWVPVTQPNLPTAGIGFGNATFETVFMAKEGLATIDPITDSGEGGGSIDFPVFGTALNMEPGCYGGFLGAPNGTVGVGILDPNPPPYTNTGQVISFSWPNIVVHNNETGQEWRKGVWAVSATFHSIFFSVAFNSKDQTE